ncbi:amino acid transporter [Bacillus lacus]|uniref:Amino acid transporter n=1 Tax=Metabacillus lacus TaxID=1983721 RepID=A0A7X2IXR0_9BACI|nr:amino acid transporter [Metabacillus lacus]
MSIFISYIILGLSLAAPIGPVNAAQLDRGIKGGFLSSWMVGLGAMTADAIYMVLVYIGTVNFLSTPFMQTFLWLFGFFVLVYTGVESIMGAGKLDARSTKGTEPPLISFLSGFLMSISNPLTILFWLGIYGSVLAKTASSYGTGELILYSGAIFIGLLLWDVTMALIASSFRKFLTNTILVGVSVLSGLSLIGFGLYFGFQAAKALLS